MTIARTSRSLSALVVLLVSASTALDAAAQKDVNPPLPNVLLLVDSSGSMEYMLDGTLPATCDPGNSLSDINRWTSLVEVLSGTVQTRGCLAVNRDDTTFAQEFSLGGVAPYDKSYHIAHHRIVSNGCVAGPGTTPPTVFEWPAGAIGYHDYTDTATACASPFAQASDGLLDVYRDRIRFGFMTFDNLPDEGDGVAGSAADNADGVQGLWSYFYNWQSSGAGPVDCKTLSPPPSGFCGGYPPACSTTYHIEVGARNAGAPPWEGRMVGFGPYDASLAEVHRQNDNIQEALRALRPYGATPLAGLLTDALVYVRYDNDDEPDPYFNVGDKFGPKNDLYVQDGCRDTKVVVMSDGEPNLDLRPDCGNATGNCPYVEPYEVAAELYTGSPSVEVYAIGFALQSGTGFDCTTLSVPADFTGACVGATGGLKACCNMARIAYEGGTDNAIFANDQASLKNAFSRILANVASQSTSRTIPLSVSVVNTQAGGSQAPAVAYLITSSFDPKPGELWVGNLERQRWTCSGGVATLQDIDENKGDDLAVNLNEGQGGNARYFYTVKGGALTVNAAAYMDQEGNIRPNLALADDDGMGIYTGATVSGSRDDIALSMQTNPEAMGMIPMPAACSSADMAAVSSSDCALKAMQWELGGDPGGGRPVRTGDELGAFYHSSPAVVGVPNALVADESYDKFALSNQTRPLMLYAASVDGQLHAFKLASNDSADLTGVLGDEKKNNELWAFMPPHVLPNILSQYPTTQQLLLDGSPVVKDVLFSRDLGTAQSGGGNWHTVLVAGGGRAGGFYYALDITDPTAPTFLWQLSHSFDPTGPTERPLFSSQAATPAIATIRVNEGAGAEEVAVAILPGGNDTPTGGPCNRSDPGPNYPHIDSSLLAQGAYKPRTAGRCYGDSAARSLTIVRVQDGKVLRRFQKTANDGPSDLDVTRVTLAGIDAPFTSSPVPFPSRPGEIANRIYIGDADGTLWRVNLADPDPANWTLDMAFDAYNADVTEGEDYTFSQPIELAPVVGVDGSGNTVILVATGEQQGFFQATAGMKTRLWSLLEQPAVGGTKPFTMYPRWMRNFDDGMRITGPMDLFDEQVYYATFDPNAGADNCDDGSGAVYGAHFTRQATALPVGQNVSAPDEVSYYAPTPGAVIFGVTVTQDPACFTSASVTDDYVGTYNQISAATPGAFKLTFHTGSKGAPAVPSGESNIERVTLNVANAGVLIDSWATIEE